ncbi:MAG: ATP-binding protein [Bacteroidota bacterium]
MAVAKKIVITGSPGTGKTAIIKALHQRGFACLPEISRAVTLEARVQGIAQLFLEDSLLFSQKLLDRRTQQFYEAETSSEPFVFIDRGIPDILAYMDYIGADYPTSFIEACEKYRYDRVFLLPPWEDIYTSDSERYENFQQATAIHHYLEKTYKKYGYHSIKTPKGTIDMRVDFIINTIEYYAASP